ncbi:MAG TPA: hypothetical protein VMR34_05415 [Candidatus Saccharimonadales bacterium]|nr:hypothetical protein [Candidatus Saccharimonadales bacterium]
MTRPIDKLLELYEMLSDLRLVTPGAKLIQLNPIKDIDAKKFDRQTLEYLFELLESDYKVITVHTRPDYKNEFHYRFEINDNFDEVYNRIYVSAKFGVGNLDWTSLLRVYEVALDISSQLKFTTSDTVTLIIPPVSSRFLASLAFDTIPAFQAGYENGIKFLQEQGVLASYKTYYDLDRSYRVTVNHIHRPKFDRLIRLLAIKHKELAGVYKQSQPPPTEGQPDKKRNEQLKKLETIYNDAKDGNKISGQETNDVHPLVRFDTKTSVLVFGDKTCDIPDETLEHYICKFAFKNRRVAAKEDDILEKTVKSQDSQRAVYDAMLRVNKKAREQLGIEKLLKYKAAKIRIDKKYQ